VLGHERFPQKWIIEQVDLADRQVVRRAPVRIDDLQLVGGERRRGSVWCEIDCHFVRLRFVRRRRDP
jgi:hypothetical protein